MGSGSHSSCSCALPSNRNLCVERPEPDARIDEVVGDEVAQALRIDDIEDLEPVSLTPDDLLLAHDESRPTHGTVEDELAQLGLGVIAPQQALRDRRPLGAIRRPAGLVAISFVDSQSGFGDPAAAA